MRNRETIDGRSGLSEYRSEHLGTMEVEIGRSCFQLPGSSILLIRQELWSIRISVKVESRLETKPNHCGFEGSVSSVTLLSVTDKL